MMRYDELTWEEIRDLDKNRVVILPVATVEDHGPHLPVNTDGMITRTLCEKVAEEMPDETVLLPIVTYGYSPHHIDFPGSLNIGYKTLIDYVTDIGVDLSRHGFRRMLIVNGHGSNAAPMDIAQKRINYLSEGKILCFSSFYLDGPKGAAAIEEVRKSGYPGGMGHACELETSLMLAIRYDLVKMDKAVRDMNYPNDQDLFMDWSDGPLRFTPYWSAISRTGTAGDPTVSSKDDGEYLLEVAVDELCDRVRTIRELDYENYSIKGRTDHHSLL